MRNIKFRTWQFQSYGGDAAMDIKQVEQINNNKKAKTTSKKGHEFLKLTMVKSYFGLWMFTKDFKGCFRYNNDNIRLIMSKSQKK